MYNDDPHETMNRSTPDLKHCTVQVQVQDQLQDQDFGRWVYLTICKLCYYNSDLMFDKLNNLTEGEIKSQSRC